MFSFDVTLAGDASSSQTYSLQSVVGGKSIRQDAVVGSALPRALTISHQPTTKAGQTTDRHLVRLDLAKQDATTGERVNIGVYLVIEMPRTVATVAQCKDMITQLKNFLDSGNVTKLLNSEP